MIKNDKANLERKNLLRTLLIAILLTFICLPVFAEEIQDGEYKYLLKTDGTCEVIGKSSGVGTSNNLVIRKSIIYNGKTYTVNRIGANAFKNSSALKGSVTISENITSIGNGAFQNCYGLSGSLKISSSVTTIGNSAFEGCSGFTGSLTIPNGVTAIGTSAFKGCTGFTGSLTIPNGVTTIGDSAFEGCSGFTGSLNIPNRVIAIGASSFKGCTGFTGSLTIPNGVTSIGDYAFYDCSGFTGSLTIPDGVASIGNRAFSGCKSFTGSLIIPNSVSSIGNGAFSGCYGFTGVLNISEGVISIGYLAFDACKGFTGTLTLPQSVTFIGYGAFELCSGFTGSLTIPDGVTSIGYDAFKGCSGFTGTLSIPKSVVSIGNRAFIGCSALKEIIVKDGETALEYGTDVFKNCNIKTLYLGRNTSGMPFATAATLSDLTIGGMVTSISDGYFSGCSALTKIISSPSLPPSISEDTFNESIYSQALLRVSESSKEEYSAAPGWKNFREIRGYSELLPTSISIDRTEVEISERSSVKLLSTVSPENTEYKSVTWSSMDESVATVDSEGIVTGVKAGAATIEVATVSLSEAGTKLTATCKVNVVPVIETIGGIKYEVAFGGGENGKDIVKVIGGDPDEDGSVSILAKVEIDGHVYPVEEIENAAFRDRSQIAKIDIPNSIRIIKENAFYGCHTLGSVTIPASVTEIGTDAFGDCTDLSQVIIEDSRSAIDLSRPFTGCNIDYLYYGRQVTGYPAWPLTIKSLETGRYLDALKSNEFSGFPNLYSLTIGVGMRTIDADAFRNSTITKVIWMPNTPPAGYESIKADINYVSTNNYEFENKIVSPNLSSKFMVDGLVYVFNRQAVDRTCAVIDNRYNRHIPGLDVPHKVTYSGIEFTVEEINDYALYSNRYFTTASIGDGIVSIGKYALFNCTGIQSEPYIGKSVKTIGDYAFHNCTGMPAVTIPDATEYLGPWSLSSCTSLESAKLGTGLVTIEEGCFADDSSLKQLVVPANVTTIANRVFDNCTSLAYFEISDRTTTLAMGYSRHNDEYKPSDGTIGGLSTAGIPLFYYSPLKEVYIGGDISYSSSPADGYSPFYRNDALEKVVIHNNETEISDNEFYGCRGLKEVVVGNDVLRVGDYAFSGCLSMEYFTLGSKVATIGVDAFSDCDKMVEMKSYNKVPPVCGVQALDDIDKFKCTLFVPETAVEDYKKAEQWKNFFHIQGMESEDIPAQEIRLSVSTVSMELGNTMQLTATVFPSDATDPVVWKSSDETVVTVSAEGLLTATGIGSALITVTCGNVSATCSIEVLAIPAESVTLSRETAELRVNETLQLTATVAPDNAIDKTVVWTSSDETVVTVSAEGLVTATGIGSAVITATCGNVYSTCCIEVLAIPAESIALSRQTAELRVNETLQLTATVAPENASDKTVVWTSSDETVVTVSAEGLLTAVGVGEATVTAKCGDVTATCAVKVTAASGIYGITVEDGKPLTVYNLQGVRLKVSTLDELSRLPKGFYIVNGKKVYIK